ncbi:MAG TPA: DUF305 domain-containing protein [Sphingomicrobium sp.]|nr:DUF305 domain-containing protein [Sphingomicrobium sp.]
MTSLHVKIALATMSLVATAATDADSRSGFRAAMDQAMTTMMADMQVAPTGDVDRDFTQMMVPHHQGAIDMAVAEIRYGTNPGLKRIAQEIIVEQQQEIVAMRVATGAALPQPEPTPIQQPVKGH